MSCIATLYILPASVAESLEEAKANEKRVVITKFLFFSKRKELGGDKYLWEYLDESCESMQLLNYSGFFVINYLNLYHPVFEDYFDEIDEYCARLNYNGAQDFLAFLEANPPDREKLREFRLEEYPDTPDLEGDIDTFVDLHETLVAWSSQISEKSCGVIYLSY